MKRVLYFLLCSFMVFLILETSMTTKLLAADRISRQSFGNYIVVNTTSTVVNVSSVSATKIEAINAEGVQRIFKVITPGTMYFQYGGSSDTVKSLGIPFTNNEWLVEDMYMGDIYVQSESDTLELRVGTLSR